MATITLSSKHQVTLPVDIVRSLGLKAGDKLVAELIDDRIVLLPQPDSWTDYFIGSMKGVYGSTKEEVDRYIARERESPERWEWAQQFEDLVATDGDVEQLVHTFRSAPHGIATLDDLEQSTMLDPGRVAAALDRLLNHGGVRKTQVTRLGSGGERAAYRLVSEFTGR